MQILQEQISVRTSCHSHTTIHGSLWHTVLPVIATPPSMAPVAYRTSCHGHTAIHGSLWHTVLHVMATPPSMAPCGIPYFLYIKKPFNDLRSLNGFIKFLQDYMLTNVIDLVHIKLFVFITWQSFTPVITLTKLTADAF